MKCIVEITDKEFNKEIIPFSNPIVRQGARRIVLREDGKIAIFNKTNKNEYKLPGDGIENDENYKEAFEREVLEETGCEIEDIEELGYTLELKSQSNFKQKFYVYKAKVKKVTNNTKYTKQELDEGTFLVWFTVEEALQKIEDSLEYVKASEYDDLYRTGFMIKRDIGILNYYISTLKQ